MKPKRSLGQNFFVNANLGDHIIGYVKEIQSESIIEIGPGTGFFTERVSKIFNQVTLIEKDTSLAELLKFRYPKANILNSDFLELNLNELPRDSIFFGSLPYNVSKPIIKKIIESKNFNKKSFFIIQKEVADKYIYREPYSTLSLTTHIYANCKKILDISPQSFKPQPNVFSSLISFTPNIQKIQNISKLEELINISFRQPRKNILNNLKGSMYEIGCSKYKTYRPAQLDLDKYIDILNHSL